MINKETVLYNTRKFVESKLKSLESGHDWWHTKRVVSNALAIAEEENADVFIVELSALLHDVADAKFNEGNDNIGPKTASDFLKEQNLPSLIIDHVVNIIKNVSYKGGKTTRDHNSKELDAVQDADRLDAIGAIGIARTFNYGGFENRPIYDPKVQPNLNMDVVQYRSSVAPTLNHFYEKLLLLKDKMNTAKGIEMAEQRHKYLEGFLEQFYTEWNVD